MSVSEARAAGLTVKKTQKESLKTGRRMAPENSPKKWKK